MAQYISQPDEKAAVRSRNLSQCRRSWPKFQPTFLIGEAIIAGESTWQTARKTVSEWVIGAWRPAQAKTRSREPRSRGDAQLNTRERSALWNRRFYLPHTGCAFLPQLSCRNGKDWKKPAFNLQGAGGDGLEYFWHTYFETEFLWNK